MRAAAGLDAGDALRRKRAGAHQVFGVPLGVDVVGDRRDLEAVAQPLAQRVHQRGLAGADRPADADAQRPVMRCAHVRNNLVYCVSCFMLAMSARNAAPPTSSSLVASARSVGRRCDRLERGEQALAFRLPQGNEPHAGRDQIGGDGMKIGVERRIERDAVAGRRDADRDGIGDWAVPDFGEAVERGARPGRAGRLDKGAALRGGFEMPLLRGRERGGQLGNVVQRLVVVAGNRTVRMDEEHRVAECAALADHDGKPPPQALGILDVAGLNRPFEPLE